MSDSGRSLGDCRHGRSPEGCLTCLGERVRALERVLSQLIAAARVIDALKLFPSQSEGFSEAFRQASEILKEKNYA